MRKSAKERNLRSSILDRLFDDAPTESIDQEKPRSRRLKELRNSVRRDLENLLNSRCCVSSPPKEHAQLQSSLINYGIPDLATVNMLDVAKKNEFTRNMEQIIKTFEPRFKSIKMTYIENPDKNERTLRFRIDAVMWADPEPELIVFDSVLEPVLRTMTVEDPRHA